MSTLGIAPRELDLILGGPPCQPFSKSALWAREAADPIGDERNRPLLHLNRLIDAALPRAVVLENVGEATSKTGATVLESFERALERINRRSDTNYRISVARLNAAEYGVPQSRERVFVIALRDGQKFVSPPKTVDDQEYRTAWDAIGDLDHSAWPDILKMKGKWADLLPSIPEGMNYLFHTERGGGVPLFGWRTRYWSFLLKLAKNRPAWTIQASPGPATGPFHWRNRLLSVPELKRLQTFPDSYEICGSSGSARKQLGNAVPPALAEAVALQLRRFFGEIVPSHESKFVRPSLGLPPAPEAVSAVPTAYLHLQSIYQDHPGPGLGPGARQKSEGAATQRRP